MTGRAGEPPLDGWSIVHFLAGAALGLVVRGAAGALVAFVLLVAYEGVEGLLRRVRPKGWKKGLFEHESWPNIASDVLFGQVGWLMAQGLPSAPWHWP